MHALLAAAVLFQAGSFPLGASQRVVQAKGLPIEVFAYKPPTYRGGRIIMVFPGVLRNASEYRDHAKKMGDRFRALIVAPLFDARRFPSLKYQMGGILDAKRNAIPPGEWTYALIPEIVRRVRSAEKRPKMPYYLIGHSAGGQFLLRMAAFSQEGAARIVAANPGSHLFPDRERPFGYGFGNLPEVLSNNSVIRRYLAQPLTLYLGTADAAPDDYFDASLEAMKQGSGRYQRGMANYLFASRLARQRGWKFGWRLVEAPGVAHDHEKMFDHSAAALAFGINPG